MISRQKMEPSEIRLAYGKKEEGDSMVVVLAEMCRGDCRECQIGMICRAILRWNRPAGDGREGVPDG